MKATGRSQYRCLLVSILTVSTLGSKNNKGDSFFSRGKSVSFPTLSHSLKHSSTQIIHASRDLSPTGRISEAKIRVGETLRAIVSQLTPIEFDAPSHNNYSDYDTDFPSSGEISVNSGLKSPLAYRYYARNPKLSQSYGSLPFLLIGPNIDHWKVVARELASRGYNVIVCERVGLEEMQKKKTRWTQHDSTVLIQRLLDALQWNTVVMIACDEESIVAVEAAMNLAPERISSLVLCGRIPEPEGFWKDYSPLLLKRELGEYNSIDGLLQDNLQCPFSIVWDGAIPPPPEMESREAFSQSNLPTRILILGGGSAPHRRRPELFAWSMTRFVEKNLVPGTVRPEGFQNEKPTERRIAEKNDVPLFMSQLSELFNPESFVVGGRLIATAILYAALLRTLFFQYGKIRWATINVGSALRMVFMFPITVIRGFIEVFAQLRKGKSTLINVCCAAFDYICVKMSRHHDDVDDSDIISESTENQNGSDSDASTEQEQKEDGDDRDESESEGDADPPQEGIDPNDDKRRKHIPRPYFYLDNVIV